jgi:CubicO group peptidase (beta-lactamase class C family)
MAIAVVMDDEIVLAHGFGMADLEENTPVTPETIFAIGSATKAFTSTLVGMMVDEGKMNWDDPVTRYLPYFTLNVESDDEKAEVTLRDVLSHRTGFTRMGLLFANGKVPIEEILHDATMAEPFAKFREKFYYSNVMYMSAGVAAGKAAGTDWQTLVAQRIFRPLGMDSTTTSVSMAQTDPRLSLGYLWDEDLMVYEHRPMRPVDNIAPAGAINSNVLDMAQWVRLQLGEGEYDGQRLISKKQLRETWTGQIKIADGIDYGLGWMIREWKGQPVIEHGGNVDGFSAQVALLPESDLGFVLLTNASVSPLPQQSINMVWEALLGEWEEAGSTDPAEYEQYTGAYIANFGTFKNTEFRVLVQDNHLAVDVPGQQVYELKEPDKEGKWYFAISDDIAVSFDRDNTGNVTGMKMYQAGMVFELPKQGVEITPELPLDTLQKYLRSYDSEELDVVVKVLIQNNRLAVDWPGQMVYELYPPDDKGRWAFRIADGLTVQFNEAPDGTVESLTFSQAGRQFIMSRVEGEQLPSVEEVLALCNMDSRDAALRGIEAYKMNGTLHSLQSGVKGELSLYVAYRNRFRVDADYGKYGSSSTAVNGDRAWIDSDFAPFDELHGKYLEQMKQGHPEALFGDWRHFVESIAVLRSDSLDGQKVYVMEVKHNDLPAVTLFIDAVTGDVLKSDVVVIQQGGIGIPVTTRYEDYREIYGVHIPFREISSNEQTGKMVTQWEHIETHIDIDDLFFILTPPSSP